MTCFVRLQNGCDKIFVACRDAFDVVCGKMKQANQDKMMRITVNVPLWVANELARMANIERRSLAAHAGVELEKSAKQSKELIGDKSAA